ncbi:MAG: IS1595 family transposase [Chitinophagaceae bacterium]
MFNNLRELILSMPDEKVCKKYLADQRWEGGKAICPYCGYGKCYHIENGKRYKCGSKECYKKFSVITGTVFEASNIPLVKWFTAIYLIASHKKGISSYQLGKDIGVTQKTGWFMLHRIRELMRPKETVKLDNIIEIDETYVGGIVGNMSKSKRAKLRTDNNGTIQNKTMVMGLLERGGNLKLIAMGKDNGVDVIQPLVRDNVDTDGVLITDGHFAYTGLAKEYAGHEVVNHKAEEYVRDGVIHTNSIEGAFSLLKRSIIGIYHQVTPKHLSRYCDETMYRYNSRKMKDADRFTLSLQQAEGRLTYKALVQRPETTEVIETVIDTTIERRGKKQPVIALQGGVIVGEYESIRDAARKTGIKFQMISRVLSGKKATCGGFVWKYA